MDKEATKVEPENTHKEFTYQGSGDTLSDVVYVGDNWITVNVEDGNSEGLIFTYWSAQFVNNVELTIL